MHLGGFLFGGLGLGPWPFEFRLRGPGRLAWELAPTPCMELAPIPPLTGMREFEHKVMDARGLGQRSSACRSRRDVGDVERGDMRAAEPTAARPMERSFDVSA